MVETPGTAIGKIQEAQVNQGNTIVNISTLKTEMLDKISRILKNQEEKHYEDNTQHAKNPHGDGGSKC